MADEEMVGDYDSALSMVCVGLVCSLLSLIFKFSIFVSWHHRDKKLHTASIPLIYHIHFNFFFVCVCACVCACVCVCVCPCACMPARARVHVHVCVHLHMCVCVCTCVYVCVCVYLYVFSFQYAIDSCTHILHLFILF